MPHGPPYASLVQYAHIKCPHSSLGLFSSRLYKIYRLEHRASTSTGAVEGILAAAVLYTLAVTLINCCLRSKTAPTFLRWLLIALDLLFVGAFIAVAELTKPNGEPDFHALYMTSLREVDRECVWMMC